MNFLAHIYLSGGNQELILGNLIADAVKGREIEKYQGHVLNGILLHRKIDAFTDSHPCFTRSVNRLKPQYHKFSGVIADMYYDHFLAYNWSQYSDEPLSKAAKNVYQILFNNFKLLPGRTKRILPFMVLNNWLENYANLNHLNRQFKGMARRTSFVSNMENAVESLKLNYADFYDDFFHFFPDIIDFVERQEEYQVNKLKINYI